MAIKTVIFNDSDGS